MKATTACRKKRSFVSEEHARKAIKTHRHPMDVQPYRCRVCGSWHIASTAYGRANRITRLLEDAKR